MLKKFSLYGFLKNQQYYEYFLLLAFRQMGLSYFVIGLLIAFREIMINIMEIPSGAIADLSGRRRAMIFSFAAYIVSFFIFGFSGTLSLRGVLEQHSLILFLMLAMFFFAIGEAFRSGTHKSIIFMWLEIEDRIKDRTRVYGYTRSWSKIGSAVSVLLACVFVFATSNFIYVFFFAIIPYVLNILNLASYPRELDGKVVDRLSVSRMLGHLKDALVISFKRASLKRLILESMGFEGFFKASKDYLQPILKSAALPSDGGTLFRDGSDRRTKIRCSHWACFLYSLPFVCRCQSECLPTGRKERGGGLCRPIPVGRDRAGRTYPAAGHVLRHLHGDDSWICNALHPAEYLEADPDQPL